MQKFCDKCKTRQVGAERVCSKCGAPYGGERWPLLVWLVLIALPGTVFILDGRLNELMDVRIFIWYLLPLTLMTAILYDHNPTRCSIYFWGGAAVIAPSVFLLQ
jgi:hypothetical protein